MSLWNKLITHPDFERFKTIYNNEFPLEVRFVCANWIEERMKADSIIDINDPQILQAAANFLHSLIHHLQHEKQKLVRNEQLSIKYRLDAAIDTFTQHLSQPFAIYKQIRDTISYEQHFVENVRENQQINCLDQEAVEINEKLKILTSQVLWNKEKQAKYKHEIEQYKVLEHMEMTTQMYEISDPLVEERRLVILEQHQRKKLQMTESINARSVELNQSFVNMIVEINAVQSVVILKRLSKWNRDQALAGNGAPLNTNTLDEIQSWYEKLAHIIWNTRCSIEATRELTSVISMNVDDVITRAYTNITNLLQNLIVSGFIVEKQPPRVMNITKNFTATVRLLTANLGTQLKNPKVVVSILSESQAQEQQQHYHMPLSKSSGEILNNTGNLDIQQSTRHFSCCLKHMKLQKIKRSERKGTESVTDEKYALLFKTTFQTADIQINVWVMSLPVVVTVHSLQDPQSWATITWDNAFSDISRVPFQVPDTVNWSQLISALNMKFTYETGRGLTAENLRYLYEKAFGTTGDPIDRPISWSQFCKKPLPARCFTFWDWFYAIMKLTRDHFQGPWSDGLIIGFINKQEAENNLLLSPPGTFLLRFSDSEIGGITIAWVDYQSPPSVVMLHPFSSRDFEIRSLGDRIRDLTQCVTLHTGVPKETVFTKYYTQIDITKTRGSPYVYSTLKTTVADPIGNVDNPINFRAFRGASKVA